MSWICKLNARCASLNAKGGTPSSNLRVTTYVARSSLKRIT